MALINVQIKRDLHPPETEGVHYRLLCMTGKNKGISYYLTGNRVIMGRGDKADIQVHDAKSSREHAELILNNGRYIVTDLGSQNGLVVNDLKISQHTLVDGDKVIIGATVYKFNRFDITKNELALVEDDDDEDDEDDEDEEAEEEELRLLEEREKKKKKKKKQQQFGAQEDGSKKRILMIIIAALAVWVLLEEEPQQKTGPKQTKGKTTKSKGVSLDEKLRQQTEETREVQRKVDAIIHRGLREFRERNYFRAIRQFEIALITSPNNGKAIFYRERAKQRLDEEIDLAFLKARREADGLKYNAAIVSYCSIVRLLQAHKEDERFKDAMKNIRTIEKEMGKFKNEIKCIQE